MSNFATFACYCAMKELNSSETDLISAYARIVSSALLKSTNKCNLDIYSAIRATKDIYGLKVPYHAMQTILARCRELGFIRFQKSNITLNDTVIEKDGFEDIHRSKETQFSILIKEYKKFLESNYKQFISDEQAYEDINEFIEKNNLSTSNIRTNTTSENRWKFSEFLLKCEEIGKYVIIDYLNEYIVGLSLTQFISFEGITSSRAFENTTVYIDAPIIFKLLGIDILNRKDIYSELIKQMQKLGISIKIYDHTMSEVLGIIEDSKQWIHNPNFNEALSNETSYYFVSNNYSVFQIDEIAANAEKLLKSEYNIQIIRYGYPKREDIHTIFQENIKDYIKEEYDKTGNTDYNEYTIDLDAKSIFLSLHQSGGIPVYQIRNLRYLFLTTNHTLAKVGNRISQKLDNGVSKSLFPIVMDDITWGTIVWLDSPNTISRFSRSKLTSAAYASFKPSDSIINKFSESLNELCRTGKISAEECYTLRTQPSARRILLKLTQNDESKYLDVTPLEIIKQYKQEGYNKGVEEKNEEIEQLLLQAEQAKEEANKQLKFLECQRAEEFKRANMAEIKYKMKEAEQELNDLENHKLHLLAEIEQEDKKIQKSQNGYKRCLALHRIIISLVLALIILKLLPLIVKAQEIIEIILGFISFIAFLFGLNSNIIKDKTDWILDKCVPKCYKRNKNNKNKLESQLATLESDILASKQKINDLNKDLTNQQPKELTMV